MGKRHVAAVAAPLAALVLGACGAAPAAEKQAGFESVPVEQKSLDVKVEASGTLQPPLIVEVKSKASGQVLQLFAQTGDEVRPGQKLAEIDPRDVRNAYAQAEADLEVAKAQLQTATEQRKRADALRKSNVITAQEYESATLSEASAKSQLVKAQVNLQLAQQKLGDVSIEAPVSATVIEKTVEVGNIIASASQTVSGGTTLFKIANTDTMEVKALVDETDIGRVQPGQPATVTVEAYQGRTFPGYVLKIEPQATIDQNVTMFPVIIRIDNREKLLKTGMNADVQIQVAKRNNVLVVPNDAVVSTREATSVGTALGLSEEQVQKVLDGPVGGEQPAQATPGGAGTPGAAPGAPGAPAAAGAAGGANGGLAAQCQAIRSKLRSAGPEGFRNMSEEDRATMRKCRELFMAQNGGMGGGFGGGFGGGRNRANAARPGIIFVETTPGKAEPRKVLLGVNDWDYTEVTRGLKQGDKVILASVARIQQQTTEMQSRIRERSSGPLGGGTGGPGPGGRGR